MDRWGPLEQQAYWIEMCRQLSGYHGAVECRFLIASCFVLRGVAPIWSLSLNPGINFGQMGKDKSMQLSDLSSFQAVFSRQAKSR
jgi:hypothetical protein